MGGGVNNYRNDGAGKFSTTGNPALFLLDLSKAAGSAWSLGSNYYKIMLPVDSTLSVSKATGHLDKKIPGRIKVDVCSQSCMAQPHVHLRCHAA